MFTVGQNFTLRSDQTPSAVKTGAMVAIDLAVQPKSNMSSGVETIGTLTQAVSPANYMSVFVQTTTPLSIVAIDIGTDGVIVIGTHNYPLTAGSTIWIRVLLLGRL